MVYRVDIDCSRFPGNNKAGDTVEERASPELCIGHGDRHRNRGALRIGS